MPIHNTGLFIIRAWIETGSTRPLRASIRLTPNIASGFTREFTLTEAPEVSAAVEVWLEDVLRDGLR